MRLWSVHPRYLDTQGLTGTTRGYTRRPQLERFRGEDVVGGRPGERIVAYLHAVADQADARGYRFDRTRVLGPPVALEPFPVTDGQLTYEWALLSAKLAARSPDVLARWRDVVVPEPHPCFVVVPGPVATWERQVPAVGGAEQGHHHDDSRRAGASPRRL